MTEEEKNAGIANNIGLIIKIDGTVEEFTYHGYDSLSDAVGGLIEVTTSNQCPETGIEYTLWGNEEGRLYFESNPAFKNNYAAQRITAYMCGLQVKEILSLHGTFVVLGCDEEGSTIGLSDYLLETLKTLAVSSEEAKKHEDEYDEPKIHFV